jgi:hypothetical protein
LDNTQCWNQEDQNVYFVKETVNSKLMLLKINIHNYNS